MYFLDILPAPFWNPPASPIAGDGALHAALHSLRTAAHAAAVRAKPRNASPLHGGLSFLPLTFPSSPSWRPPQRRIRAQLRVAVRRHPGRPGGRPLLCVLYAKLIRPFRFIAFSHCRSLLVCIRNGYAISNAVWYRSLHGRPEWAFHIDSRYKSGYPPACLSYSPCLLF